MHNIITIIVTIVKPPHGKGVTEAKKDFKRYFGINPRQIIRIENDNNLCLFYATEMSRLFHDEKIINDLKKKKKQIPNHLLTKFSFARLLKNSERKRKLIYDLINKIGIDGKDESYGLDNLQLIQDYYDTSYPGLNKYIYYHKYLYLKDCIGS